MTGESLPDRSRRSDPSDANQTDLGEDAFTALLTIDLDALAANYRSVRAAAAPAECAAVVKADAYGLGMAQVAPALWRQGCRSFFVATIPEASALRSLLPDATIYVLDGLLPGTAPLFRAAELRPILNSYEELREWSAYCGGLGKPLAAALHVDSGMNRLGLSEADFDRAIAQPELFETFDLALVMSHLACADTLSHAKNEAQRRRFEEKRRKLPAAPASLANSGGILMGPAYHFDLVRPGIALYGGQPGERSGHRFEPVVTLQARILQIREAAAEETVGYAATRRLAAPARIATVGAGYADGLSWHLSAGDGVEGLNAYLGSYPAPILGRVSMDLITLDVTGVPESHAHRGALAELIGKRTPLETIAARAGTVNYEVLTNLCRRAVRRYIGG